jgi:hypothetical protein
MAVLLWEFIIAAAFVLVVVGALAYVLANLLLAAIHKGAEKKFAGANSARAQKRSHRLPNDGLRTRFTGIVFRSTCSPSVSNRVGRKNLSRKASGKL